MQDFDSKYTHIGTLAGADVYVDERGWFIAMDEYGLVRNRATQTLDEMFNYIVKTSEARG